MRNFFPPSLNSKLQFCCEKIVHNDGGTKNRCSSQSLCFCHLPKWALFIRSWWNKVKTHLLKYVNFLYTEITPNCVKSIEMWEKNLIQNDLQMWRWKMFLSATFSFDYTNLFSFCWISESLNMVFLVCTTEIHMLQPLLPSIKLSKKSCIYFDVGKRFHLLSQPVYHVVPIFIWSSRFSLAPAE